MTPINTITPNDCQNVNSGKLKIKGISQFHNHINGYVTITTTSIIIASIPKHPLFIGMKKINMGKSDYLG